MKVFTIYIRISTGLNHKSPCIKFLLTEVHKILINIHVTILILVQGLANT